jgi:tetratricopeptide (TPR) repeat protein
MIDAAAAVGASSGERILGKSGQSSGGRPKTMPSIRELRDQKQRESFTGRQVELNTFRRLITAESADYAILHIYGVGGIGKSSLLRQFRRIAQELGYPVAIVDMQVHFSVDEILRSVREQVGRTGERAFADFDKALDMFNDVKSRLQGAVGSVTSGIVSGLREGVPLGLGALAVDTIGEEQMKAWLYRHLPRASADLYLHSDRILTEKLIEGLNYLTQQNGARLIVMLDTYEQSSQAQDDWLRDTFLDSNLSSDVLIVVAGRDPLSGRWHEWRNVLLSRELQRFTEEEARRYLRRRGITDPALAEALQGFTERLPWALALVTDTPGVSEMTAADFQQASYRHVIGDKLVERFASQVEDDADMRELVDVCTVVRTFDHDVVRALWDRQEVDGPMRRLRRYSFVHVRADGRWSLNQVVREFLDQGLRRRSLSRWTELNSRAAAFYQEQAASLPTFSGEWNWRTLESLYHQLRLDEDNGILQFSSLFEEAKHLSRYDFCSELLNNIQDVQLTNPYNQHWLTFYRGVISRVTSTFGWDEAYAVDQKLYDHPDLPRELRARVTTDLGRYYYQILGEHSLGIEKLHESLKLRRDIDDEQGQAHVLSHLAVAQSAIGDFDAGRRNGLVCVELAQKLDAPYRLGWGYYSLGVVEKRTGNVQTALDHFRQSLEAFEAAGYEFEPGVVRYQIGRLALSTGELEAALEHFRINVDLMQKYDKFALAARTMVDICEVHLAREDAASLAAQAAEAQRLIIQQNNHAQLSRLRLVQAEVLISLLLSQHHDGAREGAELAPLEEDLVATVTDRYLDGLLASARTYRPVLLATVERIERQLEALDDQGWPLLARMIAREITTAIDQALEGVLARHGQLVVLSPVSHQSLQALELAKRWVDVI